MKRIIGTILGLLIVSASVVAQQAKATSVLEILDVATGRRTVVKEFPYLIEAFFNKLSIYLSVRLKPRQFKKSFEYI